jgi:hypothetical protein
VSKYLINLGKIKDGVVSISSREPTSVSPTQCHLRALHSRHPFVRDESGPNFHSQLRTAGQLIERALSDGVVPGCRGGLVLR